MRIFLIGSGPSLKKTPINDLEDEDVMIMNKYGKIAAALKFTIRPKYYFKIDNSTIDMTYQEEIKWGLDNCEKLFLWDQFQYGYKDDHSCYDQLPVGVGNLPRTTWIKKCKDGAYQWNNWKATQSWHFPELCTGFGGMSTMIQLAVKLGYDQIYLLGCDLGFTPYMHKNHAISNYTKDLRDKSEMDNGNMLHLHKMAKRCSPVPIYNCTVGGSLEVYERRNLNEVL